MLDEGWGVLSRQVRRYQRALLRDLGAGGRRGTPVSDLAADPARYLCQVRRRFGA
jgi:hypothetical protein